MSILLILQKKAKVTTKELAREWVVSNRYHPARYQWYGNPGRCGAWKNGGWWLLNEYHKTLLALKKGQCQRCHQE
jgi:hypothetical protein